MRFPPATRPSILDSRFRRKRLRVDADRGFYLTSKSGDIEVGDLSSGEQHELVLAFRLLFVTTPGSLVLIDEPELSLHIAWQRRFVDDLLSIRRLTHLDFLVATHSPNIIGGRMALAQPLGDLDGADLETDAD